MTFTSEDSLTLPKFGKIMHVIRRPDPKAPRQDEKELPKQGDIVEINGVRRTVIVARYAGDSEFQWWPHIMIDTPIEGKP